MEQEYKDIEEWRAAFVRQQNRIEATLCPKCGEGIDLRHLLFKFYSWRCSDCGMRFVGRWSKHETPRQKRKREKNQYREWNRETIARLRDELAQLKIERDAIAEEMNDAYEVAVVAAEVRAVNGVHG